MRNYVLFIRTGFRLGLSAVSNDQGRSARAAIDTPGAAERDTFPRRLDEDPVLSVAEKPNTGKTWLQLDQKSRSVSLGSGVRDVGGPAPGRKHPHHPQRPQVGALFLRYLELPRAGLGQHSHQRHGHRVDERLPGELVVWHKVAVDDIGTASAK
jgi:hypothetical protein